MADIVKDTDAVYALVREYLVKRGTLDDAIKLANSCKPHLDELIKVCHWPWGKSYKYPCDRVIGTAGLLVDGAFTRIEKLINQNKCNWSCERFKFQEDVDLTLNKSKLENLEYILSSYYLFDDSKYILNNLLFYLFYKQEELCMLDNLLKC